MPLPAALRSSTSYAVLAEGMDAGGGRSESALYSQVTSIGGIVGTTSAASPPLRMEAGVVAQFGLLHPLSGSDDFNDSTRNPAKWAATDSTEGGGYLVESGGRLEYRVAVPDPFLGPDGAGRAWVMNHALSTDSFEVLLDVTNILTPGSGANASVGLRVTNLENPEDNIFVELYRSGPGGDGNGFLAALSSAAAGGEVLPYTNPTSHPEVTSGTVRLSYNPFTQIFTAWYDTNGSADGYQWQLYGSFGIGTAGGGTLHNSPWQLAWNTGFEVSVTGFSESVVVPAGTVHGDNFLALSGLDAWRLVSLSSASNSGDSADGADPDRDGLSNVLEFALGQNPTSSSAVSTPAVFNGATMEFYYPRSVAAVAAGTVFVVEWSDTMAANSWSIVGVSQQVVSDNGTLQQVRANLPASFAGQRFVRLRVVARNTPPI